MVACNKSIFSSIYNIFLTSLKQKKDIITDMDSEISVIKPNIISIILAPLPAVLFSAVKVLFLILQYGLS
jgi:hypothetical protein